jgi:hypothetical protein
MIAAPAPPTKTDPVMIRNIATYCVGRYRMLNVKMKAATKKIEARSAGDAALV